MLAFVKIFPQGEINKIKNNEYRKRIQNAQLLVAGLCYNLEKQYDVERKETRVNFETVLGRYYRDGSDTQKRKIEKFLEARFDSSGKFSKDFALLASKVLRNSAWFYPNESLNYEKLLWDLKHWEDKKVKIQWAQSIVHFEK